MAILGTGWETKIDIRLDVSLYIYIFMDIYIYIFMDIWVYYLVVRRQIRRVWSVHMLYIFPIQGGAFGSYVKFPNHLIV